MFCFLRCPKAHAVYGRRQRDSARGRGLTQEKLTPFLLLARIPLLPLPLLRPVQLDEAKERQNKRPQNVQLRSTAPPDPDRPPDPTWFIGWGVKRDGKLNLL